MKKIFQTFKDIPEHIRKHMTRIFIISGIVLAYSPYWISLFENKVAGDFSNNLVSIGWWILAIGLMLYALNMWVDIKKENEKEKEKEKETI